MDERKYLTIISSIENSIKDIDKSIDKKALIYDIALWVITVSELLFLEEYYLNIIYF